MRVELRLAWTAFAAGCLAGCTSAPRGDTGATTQELTLGGGTQVVVEEIARGLAAPWQLAFAADGRMFFTERPGRVRMVVNGVLAPQPVATISDVVNILESGLLGLALHPKFSQNGYFYIWYAREDGNTLQRWRFNGATATRDRIIVSGVPRHEFHDGGRLRFGPDGKLYLTTGYAGDIENSQNLGNLAGKILRFNDDGSIPNSNPFPGSPIWTYGHRNPQGIDWTDDGVLISSEHGPTTGDSRITMPKNDFDELNVVVPGKNYGWPVKVADLCDPNDTCAPGQFTDPFYVWGQTEGIAPSGISFYRQNGSIPEWRGSLFVAALWGSRIERFVLNGTQVVSHEVLFREEFGRIRDVVQGPDGALYFAISNCGAEWAGQCNRKLGDRIMRVRPL